MFVCLCAYCVLYVWSNCFRNRTFTPALGSSVFLFLFCFCCAGFTLSKKNCSKFLFEGVSLLNTSGIDGWTRAFWCKGNSCHVGTQWNPDGASNGYGPTVVWRSWLETGWFTLHEDEWLAGCFTKECFNLRTSCCSSWCRTIIILLAPVDCELIKVHFTKIKECSLPMVTFNKRYLSKRT